MNKRSSAVLMPESKQTVGCDFEGEMNPVPSEDAACRKPHNKRCVKTVKTRHSSVKDAEGFETRCLLLSGGTAQKTWLLPHLCDRVSLKVVCMRPSWIFFVRFSPSVYFLIRDKYL